MELLRKVLFVALLLAFAVNGYSQTVELDLLSLGCPTTFDHDLSFWQSDFDLGTTFSSISNVYIKWSGTITAESVYAPGNPASTWPIDGKFLLRVRDGNNYFAEDYLRGGETAYPNSQIFDTQTQLLLKTYSTNRLLVRFANNLLNITQQNAILASYGGGVVIRTLGDIVPGLCVVELPHHITVPEVIAVLNNAPECLYAEPHYYYYPWPGPPPPWQELFDGHGTVEIQFNTIYRSLDLNTSEHPIGQLDSAVLVIDGTVIPEPATMLLFGVGAILLRTKRRA